MDNVLIELGLVLIIATGVSGLMYLLKQPLIIGHIITGLLVGPYFLNILKNDEMMNTFSQIGIALLIFIIGLSLSPRIVKEVGKVSAITGIGQVVFTSTIGFLIGRAMGFSTLPAIYIAIALTFSSTIIILKLLSDKRDLNRLYGKISTGFLLIQDIIAMIILLAVTSVSKDQSLSAMAVQTLVKAIILIVPLFLFSKYLLPILINFFARSTEFLFVFSVSWGLGVAILFYLMGFSIEVGALFAGVALASSPFNLEIASRMRPLRDFFIILFFVVLGSHLQISSIAGMIWPAIILSAFILIGNPFIVLCIMGFMGYSKKTSFKAGLTVAQISEFSLILVVLGQRVGHLSQDHVSLITTVGLFTIAVSTYYIIYSDQIFSFLSPALSIFERKSVIKQDKSSIKYDAVLFGFDSVGNKFIDSFKKLDKKFLVIDFNPETVEMLSKQNINCLYGDVDDNEFLDELNLENAKIVVSTISSFETNSLILRHVRSVNKKAIIIVKTDQIKEATELYRDGASYVMMPHYLGTTHTCSLIDKNSFDFSHFTKEREQHISYLMQNV